MTPDSTVSDAVALVRDADTVVILAGSGLSEEVGIHPYWSQEGEYGSRKSAEGYTALQHSNATLWLQDPEAQMSHANRLRREFNAIDFPQTAYGDLLGAVAGKDYFCLTSNVDGGFVKAGFAADRIYEVEGSYEYWQCIMDPYHGLFNEGDGNGGPVQCPVCDMPARPNTMLFYDNAFNSTMVDAQRARFDEFMSGVEQRKGGVVVLELGVGDTMPRLRQLGNRLHRDFRGSSFVHVNVEPEPEFLFGTSLPEGNELWVQMKAGEFIGTLGLPEDQNL